MNSLIGTSPVFVLCCARSGSTLLRCILNSHPDYCCPPELHLAFLSQQLYRTYYITLKENDIRNETQSHELACKNTFRDIDRMMTTYAQEMGKSVWCEKSVSTIDMIDATSSIFPKASYICLYRNCLDMVASAMEILQQPAIGANFGFESFLRSRPENQVEALIEYWNTKIGAMLLFEQNYPGKFVRIKYESMTQDTAETLNNVFSFLGSTWNEGMLEEVFSSHQMPFAGDHKFRDTNMIHNYSVGTGNNVDTDDVSSDCMEKMNKLLAKLEYETVST